MLSPDQLSTALEDLTGFTWTHDGTHMLRNDSHGYRVLSGGVDGVYVTRPQGAPGLTWGLVLQRLSEAAASHAAQSGVIDGQDATDPTEALAVLHWRLYASRPDDAQLDALAALWTAIEAIDGAEAAWAGVLSAMLRDPDFASY